MKDPATTRVSSKGQVVIPGWARKKLGLLAGERLAVYVQEADESVTLKRCGVAETSAALGKVQNWVKEQRVDVVKEFEAYRQTERERERRRRRS